MATAGDRRGAGAERAWCAPLPDSGSVTLSPEESRHLVRVRRVREGERVVLFDGAGRTAFARLTGADPAGARAEIEGPAPDREPTRPVGVAVALSASGRADDLVAGLAEMGVAVFVPLVVERSANDPRAAVARRAERWGRLAREAAKVNGRSRLLEVVDPVAVADVPRWAAARPERFTAVCLDPDPTAPGLLDVLRGVRAPLLLVGPEGGFTDAEAAALARGGAPRASLSLCVLRTETAALAAAAIATVSS
jgi:16S rRNA (uracil1498-N3)-methyltransferase